MQKNKSTIYHAVVLFILIGIAGLTIHIQKINAQNASVAPKALSSPKPTATATVSASPKNNTESTDTSKDTINEIKRRIEKNSDLVKGVTDQADVRVGLIGEVTRITGESLTIKTQTATVIMSLTDTIVITSGNKTLKPTDIAVGNWVSIIGTKVDDAFTPLNITVSAESLQPKPQVVALGTIGKISRSEIEFTPRSSTDSKTLTIAKTSTFEDFGGGKAVVGDFETDVAVLLVAQEEDVGLVIATLRSLVPLEE